MSINTAEVRQLTARAFSKTLTLSLLLLLCAARAGAQSTTDGTTPLGVAPGSPAGSYALSDIDTVNLFNGGLNFRLPLLKVGGRGDAGYPVTLHIEQKWTVHKEKIEPSYPYSYYAEPAWWSEDGVGWRTFDVGKVSVRRGRSDQYDLRCSPGYYLPRETLTRLTFSAPDGTEYELRDQLTNGQPVWPQCDPNQRGFNRGRVFVTSDGSAATFISDADIRDVYAWDDDSEVYPSGYMLLRDGTRFRVENSRIIWMRDRNGNKVTFTRDVYQRVTGVTDSLGRQVTITYATSAVPYTQISFAGFGGAGRTIRVGQGALGTALRGGYTVLTPRQLFPELNASSSSAHNPTVITYVELPDGRKYQFQYNSYAELARVVLPTGGAIEYDHAAGLTDGAASGVFGIGSDKFVYRRVTERRVYPNGASGAGYESRTTYSRPESSTTNAGHVVTEQFAQSGSLLARSVHYFHGGARASFGQKSTKYPAYKDGREYRTDTFDADGTTLVKREEHTFAQRAPVNWWTGAPELAPPNDPRIAQTVTTQADANLVTKHTFAYDQFNNTTDLWEYDFGVGAPTPYPARHTHTDYLTVNNGIDYTSQSGPHIRTLAIAQRVYAVDPQTGAEALASQTETRYDEPAYAPLTYGAVSGWDDPGTTARGMATTTRRWVDTSNTWLEAHVQYDQLGNVRLTWDSGGRLSQVEYDDAFSDGAGRNTFSLPTRTVSPVPDPTGQFGSASALVTASVFDYSTGLIVSATDANGQSTAVQYNDALDRPTAVIRPPGGGRTDYQYGDTPGNLYVRTLVDQDASRRTDTYKYFDGMGRPFRAMQYENHDPAKPWVTVDTEYDALGRVRRVSAPYRAAAGAALFSTDKWSETAYDVLGRVRTVTTRPDNAVVTTTYSGNQVTVTDPVGKQMRTVTDALDRLTQVVEDPAGLAYATNYTYDALGNLRRVEQGGQYRFFMYDSLGRLVRAKAPEQSANPSLALHDPVTGNAQWSHAKSYDAGGNLASVTDARGVVTTYGYDALNRATTVRYSGETTTSTPGVNHYYDGATLGRGRPWWTETVGVTVTACDEYDTSGRPLRYRQHFWTGGGWSAPFATRRTYDLAGKITSLTYPSGHSVTYGYDAGGRLAGFAGNLGDSVQRNYSAGIVYDELGGIRQEQFGTDTPVYSKRFYNSRGQMNELRVSTYSVTTPGQETNWNRGAIINRYSQQSWSGSGSDNNGNLLVQMVYLPNDDQISGYQMNALAYAYDSLNRLDRVEEWLDGSQFSWRQDFDYDRWGNRTVNAANTTDGIPEPQFAVDPATNRLGVPAGYAGRMDYDAAGNLVNDSYTGYGSADGTPTRVFDAEGQMTSARDAYGLTSTYAYDADGRRVRRRVANGLEVWQVYGIEGELLAEYAAGAPPAQPQKEYGYRGGELLVTAAPGAAAGSAQRVNVAAASNGATATASTAYDAFGLTTARAINGSRTYAGSYWNDQTAGTLPDWLQIDFAGSKTINEVDLFFLQDDYGTAEPTESMTFTQFGITSFDVQYWTGSAWANVPGGGVTGNNKVWRKLSFAPLTTSKIRVVVNGTSDVWSRIVEVEAYQTPPNVAAAANGATVTASSAYDPYGLHASNAVNGSRTYAGSYWNDLTAGSFPDWLQVNFNGSKSISEIDVFFLQDNYGTAEPTEATTFTQHGVTAFDVQYWTGAAWVTVPGGSVSGNNKVWRKFTFPAVTTDKIRVVVNGATDVWTRVVEVEAYEGASVTTGAGVRWLVADQLGTPRMVIDQTGSLAGVRRHDYLPFGEEIPADANWRTPARGYAADVVRQKFTGYERDAETGLDYAKARFYSSGLGRFVSPDRLLASGQASAPQSWNRYTYCLNSPLALTDPSGLMWVFRDSGNGVWNIAWINSNSIPKSLRAQGWRAYRGPSRLQLAGRNGFVDLLRNGKAMVWNGPNMQMKTTGQGYVNMAAGVVDSAPFGQTLREAAGITYADTNSGEYKNTKIIATGVSAAKTVKGVVATGAIIYKGLKSLADDAVKAADEATEMVYHGTTSSESITTKGLSVTANEAAAGGAGAQPWGLSVTDDIKVARDWAITRAGERGEEAVILAAPKSQVPLSTRIRSTFLDPGEKVIERRDFPKVGPGVFKRVE